VEQTDREPVEKLCGFPAVSETPQRHPVYPQDGNSLDGGFRSLEYRQVTVYKGIKMVGVDFSPALITTNFIFF
jgi:hypothetical protein